MKRKYLILLLVAGWLLSGCGSAAEAAVPYVIPWGVQFLAWVGVVAILIFVVGILLLLGAYCPSRHNSLEGCTASCASGE